MFSRAPLPRSSLEFAAGAGSSFYRPNPGNSIRSIMADTSQDLPERQRISVDCPNPPRNLPAPPESMRSSRWCCNSGVRDSITSTGTPPTPLGKPVVLKPSLDAARSGAAELKVAQQETGPCAMLGILLVALLATAISTLAPSLLPSIPGMACASAPKMTPGHEMADQMTRCDCRRLAAIEDGARGAR